MNCANHPETPAVAYCQFCGKPLCAECVRKVGNVVTCEPCLATRVGGATATTPPGQQFHVGGPFPPAGVPTQASWGTEPWLAFALGFIPGVGAMYNGQFAKGIAHVLVFALLCDLTKYNGLIGLLIAAWVIYQVFDAYHTAIARRDGLPLPNSLGLNDIGHLFGGRRHQPYAATNPVNAANPNPGGQNPAGSGPGAANPFSGPYSGVAEPTPMSGFATGYVPPYGGPPIPPAPPNQYDTPDLWRSGRDRGVPTGAVILIVLGVLFLLSNFGVLSENWIDRGWPIVLIAIGVWLVIRRSQTPPAGGVR
jgi:hypothetical protein